VDAVTPDAISDGALELRPLFADGRPAWPGRALGCGAFVAHLVQHVAHGGADLPRAARGPDLYLACACATRVRGALEAFDRAYLAHVDEYLARLGPTPAFVDEVRQELRDKLFVGSDGASPKITEYNGKGALESWVRVVALRAAMDLRRRAPRGSGDSRALDPEAADNPEVDCEEGRFRKVFDEALRGALAALEGEQRRILRRHFADGLTLDALAVELDVHRATVARRLAAARTALRLEARRRLQAALGAGESELESFARMMRSRLDLSLPSLFRTG